MDEMHDNGRTIDAAGAAQTLPSLFDAGSHSAPETPQSTLRSTAPLRGAPSWRGAADAPAPNPRREALPQTGAREPNPRREALPLLGERSHQSNDESKVKRKVSTQNPPVGDGLRAVPQTGRGNPRPLTSPQRGGSTPPLCKGRRVGVSRAGGIVQRQPIHAPFSCASATGTALPPVSLSISYTRQKLLSIYLYK